MGTAVQAGPDVCANIEAPALARAAADGKFLRAGGARLRVKGVAYGTFPPGDDASHFPSSRQLAVDFAQMPQFGINAVRLYTPPTAGLLDEAARCGLRVIVGLPWPEHVAFLDNARLRREIPRQLVRTVRELHDHPAVLLFALGNEIPPGIVRWHGRERIERFLFDLYSEAKEAAPGSLFTYINFPPTEFLDLPFLDVCSFNVYLHREPELRAYLARLQHIAGSKPLLLAEGGADSIREGEAGQAEITAMHVRAAFEEGLCGAVAFSWTDDWWRGGGDVRDWAFGIVDRQRRPKAAAAALASAFAEAPFPPAVRRTWPIVSVVVCAYDAEDTIDECLASLERLDYPEYEVILVNDGSRDRTSEIARRHGGVRVIDTPNAGLSAARNTGLAHARGEIVAYTDADARADSDWLMFLVQPFLNTSVVGSGGPNVVPPDDPPVAQCIARAPGGPTHVMLDDRIAEHVPGVNMAFRRSALLAIGGFNPVYVRAGDDVDVCWRMQSRGWQIGFAPAALVWHHHRSSVKAYWRQQVGYGEGERWLMAHHPDKFLGGRMIWRGRIYSPLPSVRSMAAARVNTGVWGTAAFPSVYRIDVQPFAYLPHSVRWQAVSLILLIAGAIAALAGNARAAVALCVPGAAAIAATIVRNVAYARRSEVDSFSEAPTRHRALLAFLHFLQPFARFAGQLRGMLSPPIVREVHAGRPHEAEPRPTGSEMHRALRLLSGRPASAAYWSEAPIGVEQALQPLVGALRASRAVRLVEVDDGWANDRDVSVLVGVWGWLDVRAVIEAHEGGRSLLRASTRLRPTGLGIAAALMVVLLVAGAVSAAAAGWWPAAGLTAPIAAAAAAALAAWRIARASAIVRRAIDATARGLGMSPLR